MSGGGRSRAIAHGYPILSPGFEKKPADGQFSSGDGREVYCGSVNGPGILVAEVVMDPFSASDPLELSAIRRRAFSNFDITAERQRILVTVAAGSDAIGDTALGPRFNVVLNWFEELKQRVPTGR